MIKMIWCEDINHGIGIDNNLPWNVKEEMNHFRTTTLNHAIACGEKTFASWGNKPLKQRENIVITLDKKYKAPEGVKVYYDFKDLIKDYRDKDVFIVGGKTIYTLFFDYADELIISTLKKSYDCNIFMKFDLSNFKKIKSEDHVEFVINYYKRDKMLKEKNTLNLKLKDFEGPLDLLDTLIREHKMDILDLNIAELTSQYLEYVQDQIKDIDIELASEYLEMSSYLIYLKSKRLIPVENMVGDNNNFEYERDKFIQRIIQYRQYKEIASHLQSKQVERKQMHVKPTDDIEQFEPDNLVLENLPEKIDVNKLSKAIQDAIDKYKMSIIIQRKILVQELSVQDIETELWAFLVNHSSKTISFSEYLSRVDSMKISQQFVVTTFLAILDLVRYSKITISQKNNDSEIYINVIGE